MKRILWIVFLFTGMACSYQTHDFHAVARRNIMASEHIDKQVVYDDYEIVIYKDGEFGEGAVRVFKKGTLVFEELGHRFYLFDESYVDLKYHYDVGQDLTGDLQPNLVVMHWSGGAHCCYDAYLFSLGEDFRLIKRFEGQHSMPIFVDLNDDGILEVLLHDWVFAYWHECFADSPAPLVVLKYEDNAYNVAKEFMFKSLAEIQKTGDVDQPVDFFSSNCSDDIFAWKGQDVCVQSDVWRGMLKYIYAGEPQAAWNFLDDIWLFSQEDKDAFVKDFKAQLKLSVYVEFL